MTRINHANPVYTDMAAFKPPQALRQHTDTKQGFTMKLQKLVVVMSALAGGVIPLDVYSLGLGGLTLNSTLNQPLDAEIELVQVEELRNSEVLVNLAGKRDFDRAGIEYSAILKGLSFNTYIDREGRPVIKVSSMEPIDEPYLNFLVETHWPNGRLLKEYTLLLDPPTMSGQQMTSVESPTAASKVKADAVPVIKMVTDSIQPPSHDGDNAVQQDHPSSHHSGQSNYKVMRNDNLWTIASEQYGSHQIQQAMIAIQRQNPDAFIHGNINRLKYGAVLRLPNQESIDAISVQEAIADVSMQNQQWRESSARPVQLDATKEKPILEQTAPSVVDKLAIVSPSTTNKMGEGRDLGADADSGQAQNRSIEALSQELAISREQMDQYGRENAELRSRLQDLDEQIATLQRLIEVKDSQMQTLQQSLSNAPPPSVELINPVEPITPVMPPIAPPPVEESSFFEWWMSLLALIPIGGGAGWWWYQQRKKGIEEEGDQLTGFDELTSTEPTKKEADQFSAAVQPVPSATTQTAKETSTLTSVEMQSFDEQVSQQTEDVLSEADIYLTYGQYAQAEDLLKQASFYANDRSDLKLKLLEVYSQSGESDKFDQIYKELSEKGDAALIEKADALRASIADNPSEVNDAEDAEEVNDAEDDFNPTMEDAELDAVAEDNLTIDEFETSEPDSNDFSLDGTSSLELAMEDDEVEFLSAEDEAETKLELARAYLDMGDKESAISILQEVVEQGADHQRKQALTLLESHQ